MRKLAMAIGSPGDWIAYVGPFPFPWGQAGSRRMCGISRSLAEVGRRVVVGCGAESPAIEVNLNEGEPKDSVRYIGLAESPPAHASMLEKSVQIFWNWGKRTVAWLDAQDTKPSHVIVYGGSAQYILRLRPWCKKHRVPLIVDVVEWYDPRQMTGGLFGPFHLSAKFALRFLYSKCDGVVAISRLLAEYYRGKGSDVIRIPPTTDVCALIEGPRPASRQRLRLVYAGTPGKKDLIGNVIEALAAVDAAGDRIELLVIGPTLAQVKSLSCLAVLPAGVKVLGKVPQSDVANYVRSADFSVLLREPLHFTNAGFPTKFVESMAVGTPVISNLTSDIGLYLRDGVEGLVCDNYSASALAKSLKVALAFTPEELWGMRVAARGQAEQSFDFRVHAEGLSIFLDKTALRVGLS